MGVQPRRSHSQASIAEQPMLKVARAKPRLNMGAEESERDKPRKCSIAIDVPFDQKARNGIIYGCSKPSANSSKPSLPERGFVAQSSGT